MNLIVEEGGFPAVRVAHERHAYGAPPFEGHLPELRPGDGLVFLYGAEGGEGHLAGLAPGFFLGEHLDEVGLAAAERYFVAHDAVLHRVFQRGIEQDFHFLALDEAHFHDAFAKTAVPLDAYHDAFFACIEF